jgi:type III secretory pathway component EscT
MGGIDPLQQAMSGFDLLAQTISDLARTFPATSDMASQMMEILDQWMQQALVSVTPAASTMPGADMMM